MSGYYLGHISSQCKTLNIDYLFGKQMNGGISISSSVNIACFLLNGMPVMSVQSSEQPDVKYRHRAIFTD
ncbi:hypothetical protein A2U01_0032768 [Trifolium medium]|uniref:Uncharacterized protein n=1 Tax=Trifolium medium TaxID=97028 RepID=A0A392PK43_9FABA|nr:hypothetical protein [Trifolium medium]